MAITTAAAKSGRETSWLRSRVVAERFAWGVVGYNVLVIVWGALVRATGSGAGCGNHWPLCNGQLIPISPTVHTVIEFTHRSMTAGATFAVIAMLLLTFRATSKGRAARVVAVVSMLLLLNEALLGALLVKLGYVTDNRSLGRVVMLAVHLSNTLLLLGALTMTAVLLRTGHRRVSIVKPRAPWSAQGRVLAGLGLVSTLVVGVTGSLAALGDTLFPSRSLGDAISADFAVGSPWLIRLRWVHPVSAVLAAVCIILLLKRSWTRPDWVGRMARVVAGLLAMQFILGFADVLLLAPVWLQLVHLAGADLYWVSLVALSVGSAMLGNHEFMHVPGVEALPASWRRRNDEVVLP